MLYQEYFRQVESVLGKVMQTQKEKIETAAEMVAGSMERDGMLYVFGCGHSHIIGEDLFYRAGGTAPVCPMLDGGLMLHEGAVKSSYYERMSGLAKPVFERYGLTKDDVLCQYVDMTKLGLVEITRKKVYKSLKEILK